jgi:hypothetical protein
VITFVRMSLGIFTLAALLDLGETAVSANQAANPLRVMAALAGIVWVIVVLVLAAAHVSAPEDGGSS